MPDNNNDDDDKHHSYTLEHFCDSILSPQPMIVNDNVMGGISQCTWSKEKKIFTGNTSLANNGGFASLRWRMNNRVQDWSYAKGLYLKVSHSKPDIHTFRIIFKDATCEQISRGANYNNVFCNPYRNGNNDDDDTNPKPIFIPFTAFDQIESRGQPLIGPVFNKGSVTEIGLMAIKPSVVGEFTLKIKE